MRNKSTLLQYTLLLCGIILLGGCAGEFESSYVPQEMGQTYAPTQSIRTIAYTPEKLESLKAEGYRIIGTSNFIAAQQSTRKDMEQAAEMGKKAGAEVVLYERKYHDKTTGVKPVQTYQPGQTVEIHGRDGIKPYHATATTEPTYKTDYVPVTINRYERTVYYLRKSP